MALTRRHPPSPPSPPSPPASPAPSPSAPSPHSSPPQTRPLTIRSVHIGGVEVPNNKRIEDSVQYIHGICRSRYCQILKRFNRIAIQRLKEIRCYRGIQHEIGLSCRGQQTNNNCRTFKGKQATVAGKKKTAR